MQTLVATLIFARLTQGQKCKRVPLAVPDKIFGLTLFLDFIDRCAHYALAFSATGSARARGPFGVPQTNEATLLPLDYLCVPKGNQWKRQSSPRRK